MHSITPSEEADLHMHGIALGSLSAHNDLRFITWLRVKQASSTDPATLKISRLIRERIKPAHDDYPELNKYLNYFDILSIVDSILLYNDRIVIPYALRASVLQNLHAAHQRVTSMNRRASTSVFWPGITEDIASTPKKCLSCHIMAPSQPIAPATPLRHPEYPFQC